IGYISSKTSVVKLHPSQIFVSGKQIAQIAKKNGYAVNSTSCIAESVLGLINIKCAKRSAIQKGLSDINTTNELIKLKLANITEFSLQFDGKTYNGKHYMSIAVNSSEGGKNLD
ncbi:hypothetical protein A3Q56_07732, partial [Intoshia linei]